MKGRSGDENIERILDQFAREDYERRVKESRKPNTRSYSTPRSFYSCRARYSPSTSFSQALDDVFFKHHPYGMDDAEYEEP